VCVCAGTSEVICSWCPNLGMGKRKLTPFAHVGNRRGGVGGYSSMAGQRLWLACAVAVVMAAGCSTGTPGGAAFPGTGDRYGAPPVSVPLDGATFTGRPCALLSAAQLQSLDLPATGVPDLTSGTALESGPACTWTNKAPNRRSVAVALMTGNRHGLADLYRGHAGGLFGGYWAETTVDGYPGVFKSETDNRRNGVCALDVGIADTLEFLVDLQDRSGEKSCDHAKQVATLVLVTLRAQAGTGSSSGVHEGGTAPVMADRTVCSQCRIYCGSPECLWMG
jgi:hypothetical protein